MNEEAQGSPLCARCNQSMELIAEIPPIGSSAGMNAYRCQICGTNQCTDTVSPNLAGRMQDTDRL